VALLTSLLFLPPVLVAVRSLIFMDSELGALSREAATNPEVERYVDSARRDRQSALRDITALSLLAFIGLAAIMVIAPRYLLRPIRSIERGLKRAERGDLGAFVDVKRGDELGELADSFNRAMSMLRAYDRLKTDRIVAEGQRVAMLAEHVPGGVAIVDPDHLTVLVANSSLSKLVGMSPAGLEVHDILALDFEDIDRDLREVAFRREPQKALDGKLKTRGGTEVRVRVDIDFSRDQEGKTSTVALFIREKKET